MPAIDILGKQSGRLRGAMFEVVPDGSTYPRE